MFKKREPFYVIKFPLWLFILSITVALAIFITIITCISLELNRVHKIESRYKYFGIAIHEDEHSFPPIQDRLSFKEALYYLGKKTGKLFALLDRDGNGLISLPEYESLVYTILGDPAHHVNSGQSAVVGPGNENVEILFHVNSKQADNTLESNKMDIHAELNQLITQQFPSTSIKRRWFPKTDFGNFLPIRPREMYPGFIFPLVETPEPLYIYSKSPRRLFPGPYFDAHEKFIYELLSTLHTNVFIHPRYGQRNSLALLRGVSDSSIDIIFRLHFDFRLAISDWSCWVSPGGIEGRVVVNRTNNAVLYFSAKLDSHYAGYEFYNDSNIVLGEVQFPEIAINLTQNDINPDLMIWNSSVNIQEAWNNLRIAAFPHRTVDYLTISEGLRHLEMPNSQPLHIVVTYGSLQDQSCAGEQCANARDMVFSYLDLMLSLKYEYTSVWTSPANIKELLASNKTSDADRGLLVQISNTFQPPLTTVIVSRNKTLVHLMPLLILDIADGVIKNMDETSKEDSRYLSDEVSKAATASYMKFLHDSLFMLK